MKRTCIAAIYVSQLMPMCTHPQSRMIKKMLGRKDCSRKVIARSHFKGPFTLQEQWCSFGIQAYASQAQDSWERSVNGLEMLSLEEELASLERSSKRPPVDSLVCILQKCRKRKNPAYAKRLHTYMQEKDLEAHTVLGNYLVSMLVDCGCMHDAQQVFNRLEYQNPYSWNAIILGYIECGDLQHVFHLYKRMQADGVQPTTYTFVALLKACAKLKDLERGQQLRAEIANKGLEKDAFVGNALVGMFGKCGSLREAQEVFDRLLARDVVSWSSMMAAYAGHGHYRGALDCFERMQLEGVLPNAVAYIASLKACGSIGAIETGRHIYTEVVKKGFDSDIFVGNTSVDMFCKCDHLVEAQVVFDKLLVHDIVSWNALMAGYVEHGLGKQALNCFEKMQSEGIPPDDVAFMCSLKACGSTGATKTGRCIHTAIVMRGLERDLSVGNTLVDMFGKCGLLEEAQQVFDKLSAWDAVSWSALITGYAQHGQGDEALKCFHQMQLEGLSPDAVVFACSLKACCSMGAVEKGREIHSEIIKSGLEKDSYIGSVLVDMYGECGLLLEAREVFDDLPVRNITSWSAMIKGYGINHEGNMAVRCFQDMQEEGVKPDAIAFTSLLVACSHSSLVFKGQEYFWMMGEEPENWRQTVYHFSCMVDLLARSGHVHEAGRVLDTLQWQPSKEMLKALLSACKVYGDEELGQRCFEHLVEMNPNDASAYVMMIDIYRNAGRCDDADRIEKLRKRIGAKKAPANALIEVNKTVHEFVVGDKPRKEIIRMLEKLTSLHMRDEGYVPEKHL